MPEAAAIVPMLKGVEFVAFAGDLYGMPHRDARRRAHEVLNYVGLGELRYRRLEEYSTGNLQRLKLAAALVHDPQLLLLDEPTNGLDPAGRIAMLELLEDLIAETGKSVFLCTHLLGDVERLCKQIVVLDRGTVVRAGTMDDMRSEVSNRYELSWSGPAEPYRAALAAAGVRVCRHWRRGAVESHGRSCPTGFTTTRMFELARAAGVVLTTLKADEENLERLFFRVTERTALSQTARSLNLTQGSSRMQIDQAHYHGWQGQLQSPWMACLAIVRVALVQVFRNKAYWLVLGLGLLRFLAFWSIIYAVTQLTLPPEAEKMFLERFGFSAASRRWRRTTATSAFIEGQNVIVMILLAFSGSLLVGSDFRLGALPFYLSRRIDRRHYIVGKLLAVSSIVAAADRGAGDAAVSRVRHVHLVDRLLDRELADRRVGAGLRPRDLRGQQHSAGDDLGLLATDRADHDHLGQLVPAVRPAGRLSVSRNATMHLLATARPVARHAAGRPARASASISPRNRPRAGLVGPGHLGTACAVALVRWSTGCGLSKSWSERPGRLWFGDRCEFTI